MPPDIPLWMVAIGSAFAIIIVKQMFGGLGKNFMNPALGARCALHPSCSAYFLQAARKHGLLAVPIIADRFVREPVASHSDEWVTLPDGRERHPDPLSDHDFWFAR